MIDIVKTKPRSGRPALPRPTILVFVSTLAWLFWTMSCADLENPFRAGQGNPAGPPKLSHDQAMGGVKHASNFCQPIENCSACHGANLQGGTHGEPSCTKCHSDRWSRPDCGRTSHSVSLSGVNHRPNYCQPIDNCTACHGPTLKGGTSGEPSCTKCHGERWNLPGCGKNIHTVSLKGVNHAPGYCTPLQNCIECHGANLQGGAFGAPSCAKCHGEWWKRSSCGKNIHTVSLGGVSHAPNYCLPYQSCVECHGSDLHGGPYGEPSCLKCHTQKKWQNCGSTQHNQRKDGVYHAANFCKPLDNCIQCHGSNLRGGPNNEPSCYRCHGEKWKESDCGR